MDKRGFQKLNRATVATVLAASGAIAVLPVGKIQANSPFTDVEADHYAYDAIMNLYNRNIISGYGSGKFGPNDPVTRGQAAKMLAQVLDLDLSNVKNPGFKDVKSSDIYYRYIAALANKGILNGFLDKMFRPNEPITRGQMAIILTKGFQFKPATNLSHTFKDVTSQTQERYYIQTVYNLNITYGINENMYAPYGKVTRGQMAAFLLRAENAHAIATPLYEVTNVHVVNGVTYAYVNGVKHVVHSKLKSIFNASNADALEGAFIEGDITDTKRIESLTKITFTASGSKSRVLKFNGGNTTFTGDIAITGSYLQFKNWTLTGEVAIEEEKLKPVSAHRNNKIQGRIASIGTFSFIDWDDNTDPENSGDLGGVVGGGNPTTGPADGSEGGSGLVTPPTGNETTYSKRMTPILHHIDFSNCDIKYLVIRANGTHISALKTIPHLTVEGYVKAFELYANVKTMYIDTQINTTMYGITKIQEVYKNSYKSVNFDADTTIDLMVVDNSHGWIDLGEYVYIDEVIIPPNKMPNEIFNDFLNDNDLIGNIKDPSGNEVDRDPIENVIVPDLEDPDLDIKNVEVDGNKAKATMQSNEDGEIYYMVRKKSDEDIPSIRTILEGTGGKWAGKVTAAEGVDAIVEILNLDDKTEYILYAVAVDEAGNISDKEEYEFRVADATPPVAEIISALPMNGKNNAEITFRISEKGAAHYLVRRADDAVPTVADVKRLGKTFVVEDFTQTYSVRELGLEPFTNYVVYMIAEDESKNLSTEVVSSAFTTGEADYERPFLLNRSLNQYTDVENWDGEEGQTKVTLKFNEALDPETATDINNYVLSGTGNLTGKPYKAELTNNGQNVVLTVPSMAAFVNNDTLVITMSKVTDLAGNEILPDTQAVLQLIVDRDAPVITITNVSNSKVIEGTKEAKDVTFNASAPGRYYYLVLPDMDTLEPVDVEDVIFSSQYLARNPEIKYSLSNGSTAGSLILAPGENIIENITYDPNDTNFKHHVNGYSIYMVMQNRDGKYSEQVVSAKFIDDILHPQIEKFEFIETVTLGTSSDPLVIKDKLDASVLADPKTFAFDVDSSNGEYLGEKYFRYAIRFTEKMNRDSVETVSNYVLADAAGPKLEVAKATLLDDGITVILDIKAIGETGYEEYNLINDETLRVELVNVVDESGLTVGGSYSGGIEVLPKPNVSADGNDVTFKYVDKVKPKLKNVIAYRVNPTMVADSSSSTGYSGNPVHEIKLTFTESVNLSANDAIQIIRETYDLPGTTLVGSSDITNLVTLKNDGATEVVLTITEGSATIEDRHRLRFILNDPTKVTDMVGNEVSIGEISEALYIYREFPLKINYGNIPYDSRPNTGSDGVTYYSSQSIEIGTTIDYSVQDATAYYMVLPQENNNLTAMDIVNANSTISDNFGSIVGMNVSQKIELTVESPKEFRAGHFIYFVFLDNYGNVSNVSGERITRNPSPPPTTNP